MSVKLRRSGMRVRWMRRKISCRSYGAWLRISAALTINMTLLTELSRSNSPLLANLRNDGIRLPWPGSTAAIGNVPFKQLRKLRHDFRMLLCNIVLLGDIFLHVVQLCGWQLP